jgi:hypothetical protein
MSIEMPYPVRLFWENGRGIACFDGKRKPLDAAPLIEGLPRFDMIDFVPCIVEMIRPVGYGTRYHFEAHERVIIQAWLRTTRGLW